MDTAVTTLEAFVLILSAGLIAGLSYQLGLQDGKVLRHAKSKNDTTS